ncbi:MAG: adenosylcobinamide-phosphate synthase CbiB [Paracoccus sp. (in: a-proteobacteria)]|nr:adenosylcobinamide-phosphate synthase CbiB [Paracoccus sp. (in: a-proteobacteria)]
MIGAGLIVAALAALIEAAFGWPRGLYARIGHPVTWIGAVIGGAEARLNISAPARRRLAGAGLVAALLAGAGGVAVVLALIPGAAGLAAAVLLAASLPAQRSLYVHVAAVADALDTGTEAARRAVAQIVGRDPDALDDHAIARAAIESLSENFSDGVVAPLFWTAALGAGGGLAYKAVNTADSMIGYRSERYEDFGKAAARLDDLVNLPASRLSALLIVAAAALSGADWRGAGRAVRQDARAHRSPNAGWPEAAMAGALGLSLAGPRAYAGEMSRDPAMNASGRREVAATDIRRALRLYVVADALFIALLAGLAGAFYL